MNIPIVIYTNHTYNGEYMGHFVRKSMKSGRCAIYNQFYTSSISHDMFNIISQELNVKGNKCEILEKYFEYTIKQTKIRESEHDSQFRDHRDNDERERTEQINKELNKLPIHKKITKTKSE